MGRYEPDAPAPDMVALDRQFAVENSHDDIAIVGLERAIHHEQVAVKDNIYNSCVSSRTA